jgi:hypothetical protein
MAMKNDTPVFEAMRSDRRTGEDAWTGILGTREAIERDGLAIDIHSMSYCPHQWLNSQGYIDLELVRGHPFKVVI